MRIDLLTLRNNCVIYGQLKLGVSMYNKLYSTRCLTLVYLFHTNKHLYSPGISNDVFGSDLTFPQIVFLIKDYTDIFQS